MAAPKPVMDAHFSPPEGSRLWITTAPEAMTEASEIVARADGMMMATKRSPRKILLTAPVSVQMTISVKTRLRSTTPNKPLRERSNARPSRTTAASTAASRSSRTIAVTTSVKLSLPYKSPELILACDGVVSVHPSLPVELIVARFAQVISSALDNRA